tara:strand:+ start:373 stop:603 length:231 start_codon:yes stop_codon:yes gene_type:complete
MGSNTGGIRMTWQSIIKNKETCAECSKKFHTVAELLEHKKSHKKSEGEHPLISRSREASKKIPPRMGTGRAFTERN